VVQSGWLLLPPPTLPRHETAIHSAATAAQHDKQSSAALYDSAGLLIESKREPALAASLLENYLSGSSKTRTPRRLSLTFAWLASSSNQATLPAPIANAPPPWPWLMSTNQPRNSSPRNRRNRTVDLIGTRFKDCEETETGVDS